ncbi:transcriptional regulator [Algoriphagus persicinus]|uniref:transcriptional regulator n=1 Tax=Algoriphagus persicinus TaxID=3108754 RepID=UPI002B369C06|nr:transcriptional regulator [Algoriphagus sp. E1-3-M2]MEB2785468.1 transcriptional regulator [Algoriphagus sp. E1-3-M2]
MTIFKLVENGMGVAIVPSSLKEGYELNVRFMEIPNIAQFTELSAIWKEENRNPALKQVLPLL